MQRTLLKDDETHFSDVRFVEFEDILGIFLKRILAAFRFVKLMFRNLFLLSIECDGHLGVCSSAVHGARFRGDHVLRFCTIT